MKNHSLPLSKPLLLFLIVMTTTSLFAQEILWEKSYGGKHAEYLYDVIPTPDYGFLLAGSSLSKKTGNKLQDNRGDLDYWIWKMDEKGAPDWQKSFGSSGQDKLRCVVLTGDGGFLLAGTSSPAASSNALPKAKQSTTKPEPDGDKKDIGRGDADFWIIKLNASGGEEWQKTIGGSGQDELNGVVGLRDGSFILAGSSSSEPSGDKTTAAFGGMDYWVVKLDAKGSILWQRSYGGIYNDELRSIAPTQDGGFIIGGSSNSPASLNAPKGGGQKGNKTEPCMGQNDYWVIKLDRDGNAQWQKTLGGKGDDQLAVVKQIANGNYILAGNSNSESGGTKTKANEDGTDFWLVALDGEQKVVWQEVYNIGKVDILTSLLENEDHTLLLGGYAQGESRPARKGGVKGMATALKGAKTPKEQPLVKGTGDYVALKINNKGEELWRKSVGSDNLDILKKVIETRDGGYLMAGTSQSTPTSKEAVKSSGDKTSGFGSTDFWVVKLKDKQKPKEEKLPVEAIPNPAVDYTNVIVGYDFKKGTATLADIAGHILQQFEITERTVPINLQSYPEGIYIVNIKTDVQDSGVKIIKTLKTN